MKWDPEKLFVRKIRLNNGGYTSGGMYFGNVPGTGIYYWECNGAWGHVRAANRTEAIKQAKAAHGRLGG